MNREAQILSALPKATPAEQRLLVAELQEIRSGAARSRTASRQRREGQEAAAAHLTPVQTYVRHTADTDWLGKVASNRSDERQMHTAAKVEASKWAAQVHPMVRHDAEEYGIQAEGYAHVWAGQFGEDAAIARESFLQQAMHIGGFRYVAVDSEDDENIPDNEYDEEDDDEDIEDDEEDRDAGERGDRSLPGDDEGQKEGRRRTASEWGAVACDSCGKNNTEGSSRCAHCGAVMTDKNPRKATRRTASDLLAEADAAYDREDWAWFTARSMDELRTLWSAVSGDNFATGIQTHAWDDEVYEALADKGFDFNSGSVFSEQDSYGWTGARKTAATMDDVERGFEDFAKGSERFPGETYEWQVGYDAAEEGRSLDDAIEEATAQWDKEEETYGRFMNASRRTAGSTCAECGSSIERDPEGESNRSWHHNDGKTHDHEAKPSGSKESRLAAADRCGAKSEAQIGNQSRMTVTCYKPAGHGGYHEGVTLDSDDNAIAYTWPVSKSASRRMAARIINQTEWSFPYVGTDGRTSTMSVDVLGKGGGNMLITLHYDYPNWDVRCDPYPGGQIASGQSSSPTEGMRLAEVAARDFVAGVNETWFAEQKAVAQQRYAAADGLASPDASSQNGYGESSLGQIEVGDAPENTNLGWIAEGDPNAEDIDMFAPSAEPITASRRTAAGTFEEWMAAVDAAVEAKVGLSVHDLEDCPFMDWYEDGKSPKAAASAAIRNSGGGSLASLHTAAFRFGLNEDDDPSMILASRRTAADGGRSYCRLCGKRLEQQDYAWYAIKTSPEQRDVGQHYCVPARTVGRPGEFGPDGVLVEGTPGGEGGQYDAPAGTIFDGGGNPIKVATRRTAAEVTRHDDGHSSWKCNRCSATVERWPGEGDVECGRCGAQYNASGQQLRDDWAGNESNWDDEVGDMEGFERQQSRYESSLRTAADPNSQNGYGESTLTDVSVESAPENTNLGWIAEGDPNAEPEGSYDTAPEGEIGPFDAARRIAASDSTCAVCGKPAVSYWYQEGNSASGYFACAEHSDRFSDGRIERKVGSRRTSADLSAIERWCDSQGLVMKDFPDHLIERAAQTGDTGILESWLERNEPLTSGDNWVGADPEYYASLKVITNTAGQRFEVVAGGLRRLGEAEGLDSPDPSSQNGYAESGLPQVEVSSAPENTNLGWIAEGDPDAEDTDMFAPPDNPIANEASRREAAEGGPNGLWCRYCGDYQSMRSPAQVKAMKDHMEAHKSAGDQPLDIVNGFPQKASSRHTAGEYYDDLGPGFTQNSFPQSEKREVARWSTPGGKYTLVLTNGKWGYDYDLFDRQWDTPRSSGSVNGASDEEAIAEIESQMARGWHQKGLVRSSSRREGARWDDWSTLTPGERIRVGFEEAASDGIFVRIEPNSNADFYGDRPVIVYTDPESGAERRYLPTGSDLTGNFEGPRRISASRRTAGLYPDENAPGLTTWADGYGTWHATADSAEEAQQAIKAEIYARETKTDGTTPGSSGYRVRVKQIGPRHYVEASTKEAMPAPADVGISVGDIFYNSWGYDQTNVDFYKVVRLTGAGVEVVPIGKKFVAQNGPGGNRVVADPDSIREWDTITGIGDRWSGNADKKSKVCRIREGGGSYGPYIVLSKDHSASKWDGRPMHETDSMFGH